jgi:hydrogenase 3 maturation protease
MCSQNLSDELKGIITPDTLILTIGNTLKGDDAAGPIIAEKLKPVIPDHIIDAGTTPENYIQPVIDKNPKVLLIIDAINFDSPPGTLKIFPPEKIKSMAVSTHAPSPQLFLDVIKSSISPQIFFLAIQPTQTEFGQPASEPVRQATCSVVKIIANLLQTPQ